MEGQGVRKAVHLPITDEPIPVGPEALDPFVDVGGRNTVIGVDQVTVGDAQRVDRPSPCAASYVKKEGQKNILALLPTGRNGAVRIVILPRWTAARAPTCPSSSRGWRIPTSAVFPTRRAAPRSIATLVLHWPESVAHNQATKE
jgi:hypothetical protein